jgi:hypothetical protein
MNYAREKCFPESSEKRVGSRPSDERYHGDGLATISPDKKEHPGSLLLNAEARILIVVVSVVISSATISGRQCFTTWCARRR